MADAKFDLKLIPEFDGSTSVVDWVERVELTCRLCGVKQIELVIPLRLTGGALDVYQQLSDEDKVDVSLTKAALYRAFAMDPCTAYEHFTTRTLRAGETVDVFFAALKKLAVLFGGLPERTFVYAFVAGLPPRVKQLLRASTSIEATPIEHLLERARAIVRDQSGPEEPVIAATQATQSDLRDPPKLEQRARVTCFNCGRTGHIAKDCRSRGKGCVRCFQCGGAGHMARTCPGNEPGDKTPAPLSSPHKM